MATRLVTIQIDGDAQKYRAQVQSIQEQHRKLYGEAQQQTAQTVQQIRTWETSLQGVGRSLSVLVGSLGGVALALRSINFVDQFSAFAEQLLAVRRRTGVAVEDLHALERVTKQNEASFEDLTTGLGFLQRALAEAKNPTSEQAKILKALSVTSTDTLGAFLQLSDSMKNNLDENNRLLVARKLLGRSSEELVNMMILGADAIRKQMDAQKDAGVITADFAQRVDDARDKWQQFKDVLSVKFGLPIIEGLLSIGDTIDQITVKFDRLARLMRAGFARDWQRVGDIWQEIQSSRTAGPSASPFAGIEKWAAEQAAATQKLRGSIDIAAITGDDSDKKAADINKLIQERTQLLDQLTRQANDAASAFTKLSDPVAASDIQINELLEKTSKFNDPTMRNLVETIRLYTLAVIQKNQEDEKQKKIVDDLTKSLKQQADNEAFVKEQIDGRIRQSREELELAERLKSLDIDKLRAAGAPENAILEKQIELLKERQALLNANPLLAQPGEIDELVKRIDIAQTQFQRLGTVSINIGEHVARSLDDIFTALITGTLKAVDIGKAATATLGRIVTDIFSQTIRDKLKFELNLFNNLQQLPGQANNALLSGGGGGGLLQTLLFGASGNATQAQGAIGPLMQGGQFLSGGGSGGGLFGNIKSLFSNGFGSGSGFANGGTGGGGFGITDVLGSLLDTLGSAVGLGGGLSSSISVAAGSLYSSALATIASVAPSISNAITTVVNMIGTFSSYIPVIGWAIAAITAIYRIMSNQQERPNAKLSGQFGGVFFDETMQQFQPGEINVGIGRKVGIKNSEAGAIATNLQQRLIVLADQWVDILNIFPDFLSDKIVPALDITNARLNQNFSNLKFSPGGKRSIQEELAAMSGPEGQLRFLDAFLAPLGAAFTATLGAAGIPGAGNLAAYNSGRGFTSLVPPGDQENFDKLIAAISSVATLTSSLANVGGGVRAIGASQFLSETDLTSMGSLFDQLFSTTDPLAFTEMAGKIEEQLKPVMDFIQQAIGQSTELFGRGLRAAFEELTAADSVLAFTRTLNSGVYEAVTNGIIESLIATAQINDLLAPLQQAIRESVQNSMKTGIFDGAALTSAILPFIEEFSARMEWAGPMVEVLHGFIQTIKEMLGLLPEVVEPIAAITAAMAQSTDLFGRGLIGALEAATQSEARLNFINGLGAGIKDVVFNGLTEAFIASAQFNELLAPLQATISEFVSRAIETGETPNIEEFRKAILPGVEGITNRGETLQPLIDVLQEFGFNLREMLGLLPETTTPAQQGITISGPVTVYANNPEELLAGLRTSLAGRGAGL